MCAGDLTDWKNTIRNWASILQSTISEIRIELDLVNAENQAAPISEAHHQLLSNSQLTTAPTRYVDMSSRRKVSINKALHFGSSLDQCDITQPGETIIYLSIWTKTTSRIKVLRRPGQNSTWLFPLGQASRIHTRQPDWTQVVELLPTTCCSTTCTTSGAPEASRGRVHTGPLSRWPAASAPCRLISSALTAAARVLLAHAVTERQVRGHFRRRSEWLASSQFGSRPCTSARGGCPSAPCGCQGRCSGV